MTIDEEMDWIGKNNSLISKTDEANVDRMVRGAIETAAADVLADKVLEKAGMFDELANYLSRFDTICTACVPMDFISAISGLHKEIVEYGVVDRARALQK